MTLASRLDDARDPGAAGRQGLSAVLGLTVILVFSNAWQIFVLGPDGDVTASGLARALYVPGYAAALALAAANAGRTARALLSGALMLLLVVLALASTLWSVDADLTLRRSVALALTTVSGLALAAAFKPKELARLLAGGFLILSLASFATILALPTLGRMTTLFPGAWRGVWNEKNALGDHMALGALLAIAAAVLDRRLRPLWITAVVAALILVLGSTSKTSLIALAAGLGALGFILLARRGPAAAVAAVFLSVCALLIAALAVTVFPDVLLGALGKDATLTGRTRLWAAVLREADKRPLLGYGYGAVWNNPDPFGPWAFITKGARFQAFEAHDTWLSIRLDLGWAGLVLYGLYVLQTWIRGVGAALTRPDAVLALPALAFLSVEQLTETAGLAFNDMVWVIFAALSVRLGLDARDAASARLKGGREDAARMKGGFWPENGAGGRA